MNPLFSFLLVCVVVPAVEAARASGSFEKWNKDMPDKWPSSLTAEDVCPEDRIVKCGNSKFNIAICRYNEGKETFQTLCVNPNGAGNGLLQDGDSCGPCDFVGSPFANKTYYINPYDARQFSFDFENTSYLVSGPQGKLINGLDLTLEVSTADGNVTVGTLDNSGNLTQMVVNDNKGKGNETIFDFDYRPDSLVVKIQVPSQNYRGTFVLPPIDFNYTEASTRRMLEVLKSGTFKQLQLHDTSGLRGAGLDERDLQGGTNPAEVWIFTTECNQNVDVHPLVTAVSGGNTVPVTVQRESEGFYKALMSVVDTELSDDILGTICTALSISGNFCPAAPALPFVCVGIAGALAGTGAGAAVAPAVFSACQAGSTAFAGFCVVNTALDSGVPGGPNLLDEACDVLAEDIAPFIEDLVFLEEVTVTAEARFSAGDFVTGTSTFQPEAGSIGPSINLEGPGIPEVTDFSAIPDAPAEFQSYRATALIICARPETQAVLRIEGTDGYTQTATCSGSQIQSSGGCSFVVPGAESGVVDTITVTVSDPTIGQIFEVIGLFFR